MPLTRPVLLALFLVAGCDDDDDDGDACFAAGTPVATPGGAVAIEDVRPGDLVLSVERATGARVPVLVTHVQVHRDRRYSIVDVPGGARLGVTANHPVFDAARGDFVPAGQLSAGSRLLTLDGVRSGVRAVGGGRGDVYDLSVTGDHVFFAAGVLVHNKTPDSGPTVDAQACGSARSCQEWPGLPPDTVHGYLFDGCDIELAHPRTRIEFVSGPGGGISPCGD